MRKLPEGGRHVAMREVACLNAAGRPASRPSLRGWFSMWDSFKIAAQLPFAAESCAALSAVFIRPVIGGGHYANQTVSVTTRKAAATR